MSNTLSMLKSHPKPVAYVEKLASCIDACLACVMTCNSCADACLAEQNPTHLLDCIRTDLDCADACAATMAMLSRQTATSPVLRQQVEAMAAMCKTCGDSCMQHAKMHEHCRICGETCRTCEQACRDLIGAM